MNARSLRYKAIATAAAVAATVAVVALPADAARRTTSKSNLIVNGDFSAGSTGWKTKGDSVTFADGKANLKQATDAGVALASLATYNITKNRDARLGATLTAGGTTGWYALTYTTYKDGVAWSVTKQWYKISPGTTQAVSTYIAGKSFDNSIEVGVESYSGTGTAGNEVSADNFTLTLL